MRASKNIRQILTALTLVLFIAYFSANRHKFRPLLDINYWLLLLIAVLDVALIASNGLFTKLILRPFKKYIPLLESFYVSLISAVGNFFAPAGAGFAFRAVYLKRRYDFPYSEYLSTLSGNYILVFLVNSLSGLLALFLLRARHSSQYDVLVAVFSVMFIGSLLLSLFKLPLKSVESIKSARLKRFAEIIYRITKGWNYIVSHRRLMVQLALLTALNLVITMCINWLIIHSLHLDISFAPLLLFSVLGSLSLFINVTPANLGIKEAIYLFSATVLGFSTAQILSIALIDRGVQFAVLLILWVSMYKKGVRGFAAEVSGA